MVLISDHDTPMFITGVFCITGTFMWSNLVINSKRFFTCLFDPDFRKKSRKQWYLIVLVFIHSIGTLACSFPNCLCAIFPESCPTPMFHCAACGGYTLGQSMAQAVLAARLYFFQLNAHNQYFRYLGVGLVSARLITGIIQCAVSDYVHIPGWGYWAPIQSPKVLAAVYAIDFVNNMIFTSLFSRELYSHYKAIEKHTNQSALYRLRQILQNAAVGGLLAGMGTVVLAGCIISQAAQGDMQIVVIFGEIAWNSVIVTYIVNGQTSSNNEIQSTVSDQSPRKGQEMSLLTSASVFGARLEAPEPVAHRKSPDELRAFKYDHGVQNSPLSSASELHGVQRVEEEFRLNINNNTSNEASASSSGEKSGTTDSSGASGVSGVSLGVSSSDSATPTESDPKDSGVVGRAKSPTRAEREEELLVPRQSEKLDDAMEVQ